MKNVAEFFFLTSVPSVFTPIMKGSFCVQTEVAEVPVLSARRLPQNLSLVEVSGAGQEPPCMMSRKSSEQLLPTTAPEGGLGVWPDSWKLVVET